MAINNQLMELLGSYDSLRHEIAANHVAEERAINATAAALINAMVAALAAHQQEEERRAAMVPSALAVEVQTIDWWVAANTAVTFLTACLSLRTTGVCVLLLIYGSKFAVGRHSWALWLMALLVDPLAGTLFFFWAAARKAARLSRKLVRGCKGSRFCPCCTPLPVDQPEEADEQVEGWIGEAMRALFGPPLGSPGTVVTAGGDEAPPPQSMYRWVLTTLGTGLWAVWQLLPTRCRFNAESRTCTVTSKNERKA